MDDRTRDSGRVLSAAVVAGFSASIGLWVLWFITHLPWVGFSEQLSIPALVAYWFLAFVACGFNIGRGEAWKVGVLGGVISALLGLLVLGSKLRPPAVVEGQVHAMYPSAGAVALGFLACGAIIGLAGAWVGGLIAPKSRLTSPEPDWLGRFAWVTCAAALPLIFIGGLVTSTASGMAVPDWPNTFGSNMFLYPLGPRSSSGVFLEHSHRLFGSMLGISAVVLALWTIRRDAGRRVKAMSIIVPAITGIAALGLIGVGQIHAGFGVAATGVLGLAGVVCTEPAARRWPKVLVLLVLAFIIVQGWLGGTRVLEDSTIRAVIHGVSAQAILGGLVALGVYLSPMYAKIGDLARDSARVEDAPCHPEKCHPAKESRRLKLFATATMHAMILQLLLGAVYRHMRSSHVLWTHAAFAVIVVIAALAAGTFAQGFLRDRAGPATVVRRAGGWLLAVVSAQFVLGWLAFMGAGQGLDTQSIPQALIRTAHQANGAMLLGVVTLLFVLARQANRCALAAASPPK